MSGRGLSLLLSLNYFDACFVLKDVVSHNKKMKTKKNKASKVDLTAGDRLGIKGLNKGKRRKLEAYQHLFYLLQVTTQMGQTQPDHTQT